MKSIPFKYPESRAKVQMLEVYKMDNSLSIMFIWFDYKGNFCVCGSLFISSRPLYALSCRPRQIVFKS